LDIVAESSSCEERCNIDRVSDLSLEQFLREYKERRPVVITSTNNNFTIAATDKSRILSTYGDEVVTLGTSNTYTGRVAKRSRLRDYIAYMENRTIRQTNETWYMFGDTVEEFWDIVMKDYQIPKLIKEEKDIDNTVRYTATIGMGGIHSGVPFHTHMHGWSEVLHGAKRWFLFPRDVVPEFDPDQSQYQWLQEVYPRYRSEIIECVIRPGEALYFPSNWYHATLNLSPYTVFISTFT
jgi:ribosomal protein L16 Arg81 hydroxylase